MREEGISSIRKNHLQLRKNHNSYLRNLTSSIACMLESKHRELLFSTFGCLTPRIRPHSDKSSDISHPTSSYCETWWMRFVDGCTTMRATPVLSLPLCRSRAQCDGVRGALLSHLSQDSARIPITPFPSMTYLEFASWSVALSNKITKHRLILTCKIISQNIKTITTVVITTSMPIKFNS